MLPDSRDPHPAVAWVLWCDGVFELVLGLVLATAPFTGLLGALALPPPAWAPVVVGVGILLAVVGVGLIALARRHTAELLRAVAIANAAGVVLFAIWLGVAWGGFGGPGRALTGAVVAVLAILAAVELAAAQSTSRRRSTSAPTTPNASR